MVDSAATGGLLVLARGISGDLVHTWQNAPGGSWSGWVSLGGGLSSAAVPGQASTGGLVVFARGNGGDLTHIWQNNAGGTWSNWMTLGGNLN
ncbi:hypothetical protein AB0425_32320 [Actinosynnema sp. NPDC051121]